MTTEEEQIEMYKCVLCYVPNTKLGSLFCYHCLTCAIAGHELRVLKAQLPIPFADLGMGLI